MQKPAWVPSPAAAGQVDDPVANPGGAAPVASSAARPSRLRMTRQAALVDELLSRSSAFRTAQDLYAELRTSGAKIGQTTVYRHLQLLAEHGSVEVVRTPTGEAAYRSCGGGQHHHLTCRCCSRSVELASPEVERWVVGVTSSAGFTAISHTLEIIGTCHSCAR